MNKEQRITINIAGRNYPLLVKSNELEEIREIEKNLKANYLQVSKEYSALETQDHLAMMLLNSNNRKYDERSALEPEEDSELNTIIQTLENHLK